MEGVVREVVDGDTLVLESGDVVRLVGIQSPKLPLGRPGFPTQPLADAAKAALSDLVLQKKVALHFSGRRGDRHGRHLAHLFDAIGQWIQGEMLERGLARVNSYADNRARVERQARAQNRGIWTDPFYRVLTPEAADAHLNRFELVEGRVYKAAIVKGNGYLNFGEDWRTDFTIFVSRQARRLFEREGIDITAYTGKRVRVRGWVSRYNGPMIEATHPEQIEVLSESE
ncbi:MAG: thermonuclease family protein [Alphaproteobacteria bacterium]|nr:thermonuclease family protein [Alphaproteobacteria bacterium]